METVHSMFTNQLTASIQTTDTVGDIQNMKQSTPHIGAVNSKHPLVVKATFITALKKRHRIRIWYYAQKYQRVISRLVYPLDYGKSQWGDKRYHMWDIAGNHVVSVLPDNVKRVLMHKSEFKTDFINWNPTWNIKRKW